MNYGKWCAITGQKQITATEQYLWCLWQDKYFYMEMIFNGDGNDLKTDRLKTVNFHAC